MVSRRHNSYPISILIAAVIERSGLKASQFVQRLGYKSIAGGLKNLDRFLLAGRGSGDFLDRVTKIFDIPPERLSAALSETESVLRLEAAVEQISHELSLRKSFRPFLWIETEASKPSSLSIAAICNFKMKVLALPPETILQTDIEQFATVRQEIKKRESSEAPYCQLYGLITGYLFVKSWSEAVMFDRSGNVMEAISGHFSRPLGAAVLK